MRNSLACRYAKALIGAAEDQHLRARVDEFPTSMTLRKQQNSI